MSKPSSFSGRSSRASGRCQAGSFRQVALGGEELAEEQPVRIDPDHAFRAGAEHAPLVVAVAAADVEDAFATQFDMWRDTLPFPVGTPFGIDLYAEEVERPLAPGNQPLQRFLHLRLQRRIVVAVQGEALGQFDLRRGHLGQALDRAPPTGQVAVAFLDARGDLRGQAGRPAVQRRAGEVSLEGVEGEVLDHGRAIIEAKLRHWNHWLTRLKPAASSRSRCSSKVSGSMTFSSALRFCAISSSL